MRRQEKWATLLLALTLFVSLFGLFAAAPADADAPAGDPASSEAAPSAPASSEPAASSETPSETLSSAPEESSAEESTSSAAESLPESSTVSVTVEVSSRVVIPEQEQDTGLAGSGTAGHGTIASDPPAGTYEIPSDDGKEDFTVPEKKNIVDLAGRLRLWFLLPLTLAAASIAALIYVNRKSFLQPQHGQSSRRRKK